MKAMDFGCQESWSMLEYNGGYLGIVAVTKEGRSLCQTSQASLPGKLSEQSHPPPAGKACGHPDGRRAGVGKTSRPRPQCPVLVKGELLFLRSSWTGNCCSDQIMFHFYFSK